MKMYFCVINYHDMKTYWGGGERRYISMYS